MMKIRFNQPEKRNPSDDRGISINYGQAKRPGRPWRWYLIVIIVSLPLLYLLGVIAREFIVIEAHGRIKVPIITVRSSNEGYIQQVFVEPLQTVTKGSKLALLTNNTLENNYNRVRNELHFLDKERDDLLRQSGITASDSMQLINFAREQKSFYLNRLRQYELLFEQKAATQAEIATARSQYISALEKLTSIENTQYTSPEIRQVAIRINQLTLELGKTQDQKQELTLLAPEKGLITELFAQTGEYLGRGQPLLDIMFNENTYISAFIPPKHQKFAVVNQMVKVKFPSGETVKARIVSVPGVTQKSSTEDLGPLEAPHSAILAQIELIGAVKTRLIHGMPVSIRFPFFAN